MQRPTWLAFAAFLIGVAPALAQGARTETFVYRKTKQADLELIVHYPPDWQASDKRPAIVFFFGGGWTNGKITQFEPQVRYLASRGMVAARADYRVKSRHGVAPVECVDDAKTAVRWLRDSATRLGIDPQRIVAAGGSAGGHLAACTALSAGVEPAAAPNALVLFNPVLRFAGVAKLMDRIGNDEAIGKQISPTLHLGAKSPPALVLFGSADTLLEQGEEFIQHAKKLGRRAELYTAPDQPHGFFNRTPWQERTLVRVDEFLTSLGYLRGAPTLKAP